jgi:hypothetical protein
VYDLLSSCDWIPAPAAADEGGDAAARPGSKRGQGREQQAEEEQEWEPGGGEEQAAELQQCGAEQAGLGALAPPAGA